MTESPAQTEDALDASESEEEEEEELDPVARLEKLGKPVLDAAPFSTFFHVVPLLERLTPESVRVGGDGPPSRESIRFRHEYNLQFSAGDISNVRVTTLPQSPERGLLEKTPVFELTTTFLGLTGTVSPLPLYIAEEVLHEEEDNPVRRNFLDIFHHRLISLLYRAVSKYMPAREHISSRADTWMRRGLFLTGLDPDIQANGINVPASVLVRLAPLLAGRGRGPRVLALALREALAEGLEPDGTVNIREFAGGWIEVDEEQRMALGEHNNVLGIEAILGKRAYDQSGRFCVEIGPLHRHNYRRFLRDGDLLPRVKDIVELCAREALDFDVELSLAPDAVPSFLLSNSPNSSKLGRDTRLRGSERVAEKMLIADVANMQFDGAPADPPPAA